MGLMFSDGDGDEGDTDSMQGVLSRKEETVRQVGDKCEDDINLFVDAWGTLLDLHLVQDQRLGPISNYLMALRDKIIEIKNLTDIDECVVSIYPRTELIFDEDRGLYLEGLQTIGRAINRIFSLDTIRLEMVSPENRFDGELDLEAASCFLEHCAGDHIVSLHASCCGSNTSGSSALAFPGAHVAFFADALQNHTSLKKVSLDLLIASDAKNLLQSALLGLPNLLEFEYLSYSPDQLFFCQPEFLGKLVCKESMRMFHLQGVTLTIEQVQALCDGLTSTSSGLDAIALNGCSLPEGFVRIFDQSITRFNSLSCLVVRPAIQYCCASLIEQLAGTFLGNLASCCYDPRCSLTEFELSVPIEYSSSAVHSMIFYSKLWQNQRTYGTQKNNAGCGDPTLQINFSPLHDPRIGSNMDSISQQEDTLDAFKMVHFVVAGAGNDQESDRDEIVIVPSSILFVYDGLIQGILAMNDAGRRYMWENAFDRKTGIEVLAAAAATPTTTTEATKEEFPPSNLNCLFLHLRENPFLCDYQAWKNDNKSRKFANEETMKKNI